MKKQNMKVIRETIVAGKTIMQSVRVSSGFHGEARAPRTCVTREQVQKNNDRLALRRLTAILNANYKSGDGHYVLTLKEVLSWEEENKRYDKFVRALRKEMRARGEDPVIVHVVECEHKRFHHHIVLNSGDLELVNRLWSENGYVKATFLDDSGDYSKLAAYLLKETQKSFRTGANPYKRRYITTRNVIRPIVKREYVDPEELDYDPKPIEGYYIPKELNRRFEHPVTHIEYLEYTMVALGKPVEYTEWPRGFVTTGREHFKVEYEEEQLVF